MSMSPGIAKAPSRSNDVSAVASDRLDVGIRPHRQELAALDRYRLGPGLGFVDGVDLAVGVDGVGSVTGGLWGTASR